MTTNVQLIGDALREINVLSEAESPSAEQGAHALRRLNQMLEKWTEDGVELGYYAQTSTTDTLPVPAWAELAVMSNLALRLASVYGATVSAELALQADQALTTVLRKSQWERLGNSNMNHLPIGDGHLRGGRYDIDIDQ